ncbi:MAG TPA: FG-GAP-like repeat-containing protein [Candidatus Saccharibacteria bacterium]|nr:FG-GAP-like repeat-containing protein [Candidatus Saccharibacteria bacterium]
MRYVVVACLISLAIIVALSNQPVASATVFTASGDYGQTADTDNVIRDIARINPDAHLALGDLSYGSNSNPSNESSWCDFVRQNLIVGGVDPDAFPFQLLTGNHEDSSQRNGYIMDFASCLPDRFGIGGGTYPINYYFDVDNVRIIMISASLTVEGTSYGFTSGSPEYVDLSNWIDGAAGAGADWVIVGVHRACVTVGEKPTCEIGTDLTNLLIVKKVDLVLHAHEHMYQRTKQLTHGTSCTTLKVNGYDEDCVVSDAPNNAFVKGDGPIEVIVGNGGHSSYSINYKDAEGGYFLKASGKNASPSYGNLVLTILGNKLHGEFVAAKGAYKDEFVITDTGDALTNTLDEATNLAGDFNGDGRDDLIYADPNGDTIAWRVAKSTGSSFNTGTIWAADFGSAGDKFYSGDFNGDGRDDIAYSRIIDDDTVQLRVALSNGKSFNSGKIWNNDLGNKNSSFYVGNFNGGSGIDDIAFTEPVGDTIAWQVSLSDKHQFKSPTQWSADLGDANSRFYVGNFNAGTGKDDIAIMQPENTKVSSWMVAKSNGVSFETPSLWIEDAGDPSDVFRVADINGDKKDDIVYIKLDSMLQARIKRAVSNGSVFTGPLTSSLDYGNDADRYRIGDFNGNGKDDLVLARQQGSSTLLWKVAWLSSFSDRGVWKSDFGDNKSIF